MPLRVEAGVVARPAVEHFVSQTISVRTASNYTQSEPEKTEVAKPLLNDRESQTPTVTSRDFAAQV